MSKTKEKRRLRDSLYRALPRDGVELRAEGDGGDDSGMPTMVGHFAVFNQWTEIDSYFEGRFLEMFAHGAFKKTIAEGRDAMRVLFQHGYDPSVGDKPLGPIDELREDDEGAYYEVPLLDAAYVRDEVLPGLEADLYGASFRFRVIREEVDLEPEPSDHNPNGLPERVVKEAEVLEFGPVTFPAYAGSSAGTRCRSITDDILTARDPERLRQLLDDAEEVRGEPDEKPAADAPSEPDAGADPATDPPTTTSPASEEGAGDAGDSAPEAEPAEPRADEDPAPPNDSAETESHPGDGRRDQKSEPLFGSRNRKKAPSWRL